MDSSLVIRISSVVRVPGYSTITSSIREVRAVDAEIVMK